MKGGGTMINTSRTNNDIVYLSYKSSGVSPFNTDKTIRPNAMSNITKDKTFIVSQPLVNRKPVTKEK